MHHRPAFALPDLLATIVVVALLLAVTAATLADNGTRRQRRQNATQLRGIHQGLVTFGNSNKEKFPGLDSKGNILEDNDANTGNSGEGDTTEARFWIMLNGDFFTPEYALVRFDRGGQEYERNRGAGRAAIAPVTHANYSYAMLDIAGDAGGPPEASGHAAEWQQSLNTQAIVMSDRNCTDLSEEDAEPISVWHDEEWRGWVLWNDNHVSYEQTVYFETRYGSGALFTDTGGGDDDLDHLFQADEDDNGRSGNDALMTFSKDEDGNERAVSRFADEEEEDDAANDAE